MMNYKKTATEILQAVGGKENIANMTHCATRLRLNLKDESNVDDEKVKQIDGVINVARAAGQYQVLIGLEVPKVYAEFEKAAGGEEAVEDNADSEKSGSVISNIFSAISSIFAPLLPALAGSGILRGILILCVQLGLISEKSGTYTIFYAASMSVFYFLPVLLAFTSAKRFGASPYLSAIIGSALLYPDFIKLMGTHGNGAMTTFMKIPVVLMNYNSTVVPIILSIWVFSYLYKWLDKHVTENLQLVIVPLVSLAVMIPLTVIVIGPLGVYGGEMIAQVVNWAITHSRILAGVLVGGGWSILVSFGIHWAINPIMINNIATVGFDYICPLTFACNFAVIGVTLGVWLKARDLQLRSFSLTGLVTIVLSAIIEPTLFGLLVKNRKIWLAQIIGGAVGGAYLAVMHVATNAFVFGSVTTFPAFIMKNSNNFIQAMIGLTISLVVGAVLAYFFTSRDEKLA
ncbi:PTS beta-glucoside transporter subunit IIABC [Companilactobacillus heilongjiangensis]|uniref:PTS beta-glucoside transporter subunit IIABC n=2 Tax=Companilactobacillus heilongjiangensis TaxID=1074467 RepID=A0A0K2LBC1_9LACO|nr:PTS beta-glucoside transporter subunit IIABC [Companilactobacillus heilongjiangensis]